MIKKTLFVIVGTGILVLGYQNCGSGNKDQFDLKLLSQKSSSSTTPTYVGPVTLTFANVLGGNTVEKFAPGSNIYATVSNAGPDAKTCSSSCSLTGSITSWKALSADGWSYTGGVWSKTYTSVTAGSHRIYFARPNPTSANNADTNGFASVDFVVQ